MNERQLCRYIEEWMSARYRDWIDFRQSVVRDKRTGIYLIDGGTHLMDIILSIISNIEDRLGLIDGQHLLPSKFSSPHQLIRYLLWFRDYARYELEFVKRIPEKYQDRYEIHGAYEMLDDVIEMADYCCKSYESTNIDNSYIKPYLDMKACLDEEDIDGFKDILYSIYKNIPYNIHRDKLDEAYFHSIAHAIMYQLGFRLCSEEATCDGRLDMKIEMKKNVYIFEFKYSDEDKNMCDDAIQQIKDKQYADPYLLKKRRVIAVGITFGQQKRNIIGCEKEYLSN